MASPPFKVKAVFEYTSPHEDDLHFPNGQIITVTEEEDDDWYVGEYVDASGDKKEGLFPKNFVEKYEPTAPPRPTRTKKKEPEAPIVATEPAIPSVAKESVKNAEPEPAREEEESFAAPVAREPASPPAPKAEVSSPPPQSKPVDVAPAQAVPKPAPIPRQTAPAPAPATESDKPSGGSFRDRIAAFNKAAPPPAPFKPGGLSSGSNNFIKKPFVAPPPSKNAYVPPPREPVQPQKVYRREEDPEILAKQQEDQEQAQRAGLAPADEGDEEEQPKPTSLKERIALLQKQQMEQASRHADAAAKKEKPKRPATKKRTESHDTVNETEEGDGASLHKTTTEDTIGGRSIEAIKEEPSQPRKRKPSRGASGDAIGAAPRKSFGDGNDADMSGAGETTEEPEEISTGRDDSDDKPRSRAPPPPARAPSARAAAPSREADVGEEEGATEEEEAQASEEEEEDDDDVDPEIRRKEELRARMAKMSGGMGMYGMFGGPAAPSAPPKKKKVSTSSEHQAGSYGTDEASSQSTRAPPVPLMVAMPGMSNVRSPEEQNKQIGHDDETTPITSARPADVVPDVEDVVPPVEKQTTPQSPSNTSAPPVPGGRPLPPPVPVESRPPPPPPSALPTSPSPGSESDDELSERPLNAIISPIETPKPAQRNEGPASPTSPTSKRTSSYFGNEPFSPISPNTTGNKRLSRLPPPIPGPPQADQPQSRAPPPPPPEAAVSRASTGDDRVLVTPKNAPQQESEGEITEYEGDYDTDIASAAPHKDALKSHGKESAQEETSAKSPVISPTSAPPPLPSAPRSGPPPLPSQPPPLARQSSDMPRAAPPPPPPVRMQSSREDDDEYDPYRYNNPAPRLAVSTGATQQPFSRNEQEDDDLYSASPRKEQVVPSFPPQDRAVPPPPPQERAAPPPPPRDQAQQGRAPPRPSVDMHRPGGPGRRSVELSRMSMDSGYVANDVDLAEASSWWTKPGGVPPAFQGRKDILYEFDESTSTKRGGKSLVTKDLYILFQDYSQTVITAQYDAQDPGDVKLEQRHEQPPSRLRQDQLEQAHEQFGRKIFDAVVGKKDTVVGDGTPQGLIQELLKPLSDALLPVGTRAYGAIVYANLANASTSQNDEIRPGDIITLRNTKFQGKHGPMHAKYSAEVGKPDHVGVVAEWDGTKKKVRAWEQGRESKKTKLESFKLDDLRSGEVKIWRVMPRSWVGWQGQN